MKANPYVTETIDIACHCVTQTITGHTNEPCEDAQDHSQNSKASVEIVPGLLDIDGHD